MTEQEIQTLHRQIIDAINADNNETYFPLRSQLDNMPAADFRVLCEYADLVYVESLKAGASNAVFGDDMKTLTITDDVTLICDRQSAWLFVESADMRRIAAELAKTAGGQ